MHGRPCTWLFDLDDTLHDASAYVFPQINRAMTKYICAQLNIDAASAEHLRTDYWRRYGATLLGLMRHHGTDPQHFLHHTHQFPDLARSIVTEPGLRAMLRRLPGRKLIVSNAPLEYAQAVLARIGIGHCFAAVYSIERLRFQPKPASSGFRRVLREQALQATACILVDDTLSNLKAAKRLGMRTVWVSAGTRQPPYVDLRLASVVDLPRHLGRLRALPRARPSLPPGSQ